MATPSPNAPLRARLSLHALAGLGAKKLKAALLREDYDLKAWRATVEGKAGYEDGIAILDKHGGWALLEGCLREDPGRRISSAAAASSGFCRVF